MRGSSGIAAPVFQQEQHWQHCRYLVAAMAAAITPQGEILSGAFDHVEHGPRVALKLRLRLVVV